MFIARAGVPIAVPDRYADAPDHRALVDRLTRAPRYEDAVRVLELHVDSWLAADVVSGVPWARKFLLTTAQLWSQPQTRPRAQRGLRALLRVLSGTRPRVGRHRNPPLPRATRLQAVTVRAAWQAEVDARWGLDRPQLAQALLTAAPSGWTPSRAHRRALHALVRRPGLRKRDLVLTLTSWETGLSVHQLSRAPVTASLVYA